MFLRSGLFLALPLESFGDDTMISPRGEDLQSGNDIPVAYRPTRACRLGPAYALLLRVTLPLPSAFARKACVVDDEN